MTRKVSIVLTGLARGGELRAAVTLTTVRPRCIDYSVATVTVDVDGHEVEHESMGITDTSALTSTAEWLIEKFGAKAAIVNRDPAPPLRTADGNSAGRPLRTG
jgi:hypothetical protein